MYIQIPILEQRPQKVDNRLFGMSFLARIFWINRRVFR